MYLYVPSAIFAQRRLVSVLRPAAHARGPSFSQSVRRSVLTALAPEGASSPCLPRADARDPPHRSVIFTAPI